MSWLTKPGWRDGGDGKGGEGRRGSDNERTDLESGRTGTAVDAWLDYGEESGDVDEGWAGGFGRHDDDLVIEPARSAKSACRNGPYSRRQDGVCPSTEEQACFLLQPSV